MKRFARALVVGKFAPLHRGHELLIGAALARAERVVLISYADPEFAGCAADRRECWLQARFPQTLRIVLTPTRVRELQSAGHRIRDLPAEVAPEHDHRHFCADVLLAIGEGPVEAVFTSEGYGDGFAAVLAERFGHPVEHVCVDRARAAVPISATAIRADVHAHRAMLAPEVYASFVERICLLGGESSGKTTLGLALAQRLRTEYVGEFGRDLYVERGGRLDFEDLLYIGEEQVRREDAARTRAARYLICDTSPLTTYWYSLQMFGRADPALARLADRAYEHIVLCAPDFPFVQDGTRRDDAFRIDGHAWYERELADRRLPYRTVGGSVEARVAQVLAALQAR